MPLKFAPSFFAASPFQVLESVFINNARGCSLKTAFSDFLTLPSPSVTLKRQFYLSLSLHTLIVFQNCSLPPPP